MTASVQLTTCFPTFQWQPKTLRVSKNQPVLARQWSDIASWLMPPNDIIACWCTLMILLIMLETGSQNKSILISTCSCLIALRHRGMSAESAGKVATNCTTVYYAHVICKLTSVQGHIPACSTTFVLCSKKYHPCESSMLMTRHHSTRDDSPLHVCVDSIVVKKRSSQSRASKPIASRHLLNYRATALGL